MSVCFFTHMYIGLFYLQRKHLTCLLHEISKWNYIWVGHILRRNCILRQVIEVKIKGEIQVTGRGGRRRRKLLDDPKESREYSHLKEEALLRTTWRVRFGKGFGHVVSQTTK
jgi:hypothetical protein